MEEKKYFYEIDGSDCLIFEADENGNPQDEPSDVIDLHEYIKSIYGKNIEAI